MTTIRIRVFLFLAAVSVVCRGTPHALSAAPRHKDRARLVLSEPLPALEGDRLKATLVEVGYGPGEASPPHSHPCAVMGYVVDGSIRSQVRGQPAFVYNVGESFYEAPNVVHQVSGNASSTAPAKFVAYFICDHDVPLSTEVSEHGLREGSK